MNATQAADRPRRRRRPARRRPRRSAARGVDGRCAGARHRRGARRGRAGSAAPTSRRARVIWVAGRGTAETAGTMLAATLGGSAAAPIVVAAEAPPWIGAARRAGRRGRRPRRPRAGRGGRDRCAPRRPGGRGRRRTRARCATPPPAASAVLAPRLWVPDDFGLCRYLAAGLAVLHAVDPGLQVDLAALADELDAEALRNSAGRELFTNPAKTLAERMSGRDVVLAGDNAAHAGAGPPRRARCCCGSRTRRSPRSDWPTRWWRCAAAWARGCPAPIARPSLFHDERDRRPAAASGSRTFVLTTDDERPVVAARVPGSTTST